MAIILQTHCALGHPMKWTTREGGRYIHARSIERDCVKRVDPKMTTREYR